MTTPTTTSTKFCHACARAIDARAEICPSCGIRQPMAYMVSPRAKHSRIAAVLFAFFLGGFGAHKFYLGKVGQGLLYLFFFWTFIPAIVAFIEAIIYLTKSDEDFAATYG